MKKKDIHTIRSWVEVKAVADPLRLRMLEAFGQRPMTTKQVALAFGEKPTKLYHHVEKLEKAGLIRLTKTRQNRGTTEKYYQALASEFSIDRALLEGEKGSTKATSAYESLFLSALEATLAEARKTVAARLITPVSKQRNALMCRQQISGTEDQIRELMSRIRTWIDAIQQLEGMDGPSRYSCTIAFYPLKPQRNAAKRTKKSKKSLRS